MVFVCQYVCVANATYFFLECVITDEGVIFIGVLRNSNIGVSVLWFLWKGGSLKGDFR